MSDEFDPNTGMTSSERNLREKTVGVVAPEDIPHLTLSLSLTVSKTETKQMESPLGLILEQKYELGKKNTLDDNIWEEALDKLKKCDEEQRYKAVMERTKNKFKSTALMMACMFEPPLEVIKYLVECGQYKENNALKEKSKDGHTAFHCACWSNASLEVIKHIVDNGNIEDILKIENEWGYTGLHCACWGYSSLDVIRYLADSGGRKCLGKESKGGKTPLMVYMDWASPLMPEGIRILTCDQNHDKHIPLIKLLRHPGHIQTDAINSLLDQWMKLDGIGTDGLTSMLIEIQKRTEDEQGEILKEPIVKKVVTDMFNDQFNMAVVLADLYAQLIIVLFISFFVKNDMSRMHGNLTKNILTLCASYQLIREFMQIMTTPLVNYVTAIYNYIDILQIGLLFGIISLTEDDSVSKKHKLMGIVTLFAWLKLLFQLRMFVFEIAIFVNAMIKVMIDIIPFIFTVSFFATTFAHVYHAVGPIDTDLCNNISEASNADDDSVWSCRLGESYSYSFMTILNMKDDTKTADGVPPWITVVYEIMMTIVLLNIVIAVISSGYAAIERDSERLYWIDRLAVVLEIEAIIEFFLGIKPSTPKYNLDGPPKNLKETYNPDGPKKQKQKKSRDSCISNRRNSQFDPLVNNREDMLINDTCSSVQTGTNDSSHIEDKDKGFVSNLKLFDRDFKRFDWNHDLIRSDFGKLEEDEQEFFKWWYEVTNEKPNWWYKIYNIEIPSLDNAPPLKKRLLMFMNTSAWTDIFFPGVAFENVLAGISRSEKPTRKLKFFTLPASMSLLLLSNTLFLLILFLGFSSFGLFWPNVLKEFVFAKTKQRSKKFKAKD